MTNRPTEWPDWATSLAAADLTTPTGAQQISGWKEVGSTEFPDGKPVRGVANWNENRRGSWIRWFSQIEYRTDDKHPDQALPVGSLPSLAAGLSILAGDFSARVYVNGYARELTQSPAHTYGDNTDTYWDLGVDGTWTAVAVANGAGAPAITANSVRVYAVEVIAGVRTQILTDFRRTRLHQNAPIDYAGGSGTPGSGSAAERATARQRFKYPDGFVLGYTLIWEAEDDGGGRPFGTRCYVREETGEAVIVRGARWNDSASQWDVDDGILVLPERISLNASIDAVTLGLGVTDPFPDSAWEAIPDGLTVFADPGPNFRGTVDVKTGGSGSDQYYAEDVPGFRSQTPGTLSSKRRNYVGDFGLWHAYEIAETGEGTDYTNGAASYGGLGLELVANARWDGATAQWQRQNAENVYKLTLDRFGLTLMAHNSGLAANWDDEVDPTTNWQTVFMVSNSAALLTEPLTLRGLGATISWTQTTTGSSSADTNPNADVTSVNKLTPKHVPKAWLIYTDDGAGGLQIVDGVNIDTVTWDVGSSSALIDFVSQIDGAACAIATYNHAGLSLPVRFCVIRSLTGSQLSLQHYNDSGATVDQSTTAHGFTYVVVYGRQDS